MPKILSLAWKPRMKDPRHAVRAVLGMLLAANLAAAWFAFRTPGGTLEELDQDLTAKRQQLAARRLAVERLKAQAAKTQFARQAGDEFLRVYFLPRQHAYSLLEIDLANAARRSGIRAKDRTIAYEPIEGSGTLGILNINASFEGSYADLIELLNDIDRSKRLLIVEQLQAQPQSGSGALAITVKLNAFLRMEGPQEAEEPELLPASSSEPIRRAAPVPAPAQAPAMERRPGAVKPPAPAASVSEPRSGPVPVPPRSRFFNRRQQRAENEQ